VTVSMSTTVRQNTATFLRENPLIAVLRADEAQKYDRVVDVLIDNGIRSLELTLSTPGTIDFLPTVLSRLDSDVKIGVGTVVDAEQARRAVSAGASYLVTPTTNLEVIAAGVESGVPVFSGGLTPTELHSAWIAGAAAVKLFPAATVGPQYAHYLRGPFPDLQFIPSGGIELSDVSQWLGAGAAAVSLGSSLIGDALDGGSLNALANRARIAADMARESMVPR
jgi:2-dehydro-3-deoxyphosphogluconate aldolase/(4S)-4-hydroxy-2-oxoglutarate aldolase